ncbi:hypothetical protein OG920_03725 [Streptomyces europaeiscabiei]|uniref:hypothetical protein n=1 Tax=Streptomyces TaxID=1883 RepID=UPI000A362F7B|nr:MULTISPECIES: hypothetical protein [Streptomyces]MDX3586389.1 hypothetical protein [Streptomyces europaeiscabiei]MDX3612434.1 hypothetical protein [Streptomyces europaeiscabiei]MDX3635608.1 hypothetical protein [Streptomyces europaeiscabiei]MDX3653839.1 hypothetical protein [Streptomyces europaeiscabiei]WUD30610.1 hypothetical protein OG858_03785 [Streptomyces europaeiscabiei]
MSNIPIIAHALYPAVADADHVADALVRKVPGRRSPPTMSTATQRCRVEPSCTRSVPSSAKNSVMYSLDR